MSALILACIAMTTVSHASVLGERQPSRRPLHFGGCADACCAGPCVGCDDINMERAEPDMAVLSFDEMVSGFAAAAAASDEGFDCVPRTEPRGARTGGDAAVESTLPAADDDTSSSACRAADEAAAKRDEQAAKAMSDFQSMLKKLEELHNPATRKRKPAKKGGKKENNFLDDLDLVSNHWLRLSQDKENRPSRERDQAQADSARLITLRHSALPRLAPAPDV